MHRLGTNGERSFSASDTEKFGNKIQNTKYTAVKYLIQVLVLIPVPLVNSSKSMPVAFSCWVAVGKLNSIDMCLNGHYSDPGRHSYFPTHKRHYFTVNVWHQTHDKNAPHLLWCAVYAR